MSNENMQNAREWTFEQFFEKYYFRFVDYCRIHSPGEDPDDVVEDAFVSLWGHWDQLESHAEFVLFSWTKKAIAFTAKAQYRKRTKGQVSVEFDEQIDENYLQAMQDVAVSVEESVVEQETYQQYLTEIHKRLSQTEQQLFDCIILNEMSIKEAAKILSKSEKAISVGISRLREKLRSRILPEVMPNTSFPFKKEHSL